ncbi:hypothetical protein T02_2699 [Trichinella nativa]|uniref:Uncharacterized protein n=1 Tax=Trichinella nativa TaxID=6335 RepID=A0A0V1KSZ7_9BILA|nr:hypothetical protein T02_2699 [Trichinella nativa]
MIKQQWMHNKSHNRFTQYRYTLGIENRVTNGDNFQTYSIHVPGLGYVFGGSECRIRHEANSQLKFWIAGMGASMQRYLKPNE